jgi:hypothetical protein
MELLVRAFPVLPGMESRMREFARDVQTVRAREAEHFYRRHGVERESWHLQVTPHGAWVIGVTQIADRPAAVAGKAYAESQHPFDRWFKEQVKTLTGIDPERTPLGPPTECLFDTAERSLASV